MTVVMLLTGCLAHMTATNLAIKLNNDANREGSPYRWHVIDTGSNSAALEKRLMGKVSSSKVSDAKKKRIFHEIGQLETKSGRSNKPKLREIRILSERNRKYIEAWVFDTNGKEYTYNIEHVLGSDNKSFLIRGPWGKSP